MKIQHKMKNNKQQYKIIQISHLQRKVDYPKHSMEIELI
jgi:hypothetical protein